MKLTDMQLTEALQDVLDTVTAPGTPEAAERHEKLVDAFVAAGLMDGCEDCGCYIWPDDEGCCLNCAHVNGDPTTGSTPDDREMRLCAPCRVNQHDTCDGGDPNDLDALFCNCKRLGHPTVTATREA